MGAVKEQDEGASAPVLRKRAIVGQNDEHDKDFWATVPSTGGTDSTGKANKNPALELGAIRKAIPAECFKKDLNRSLRWMIWDLGITWTLLYVTKVYVWPLENPFLRWTLMPIMYAITGFFMWAIFVCGHDCGHRSFSDYQSVNNLCGWILHGSILVPFSAWARSHKLHHLNHNHVENDYSFPWCHDPKYDTVGQKFLEDYKILRPLLYPVLGYWWYLNMPMDGFGIDGNHYLPNVFKNDRIWHGSGANDVKHAWISTFVCFAWAAAFTHVLYDGSFLLFLQLYIPAWFGFCYMLFTVTYLQHHSPSTKVYDDSTWDYVPAAFETVDRTYGKWIDIMHHHISDCHVVHHLFFNGIPHYHLRKATDALVKYMKDNDLSHLYRVDDTRDFYTRVFKYTYESGFRAVLITAANMEY